MIINTSLLHLSCSKNNDYNNEPGEPVFELNFTGAINKKSAGNYSVSSRGSFLRISSHLTSVFHSQHSHFLRIRFAFPHTRFDPSSTLTPVSLQRREEMRRWIEDVPAIDRTTGE